MKKLTLALFFGCFLTLSAICPVLSVRAAPASDAEAQRLTAVFQTYLGKNAPGEPHVSVTPKGDDYVITIDIALIVKPLEQFNFKLQAAPVTLIATPQDDGLWKVVQNGLPETRMNVASQEMVMRFEGLKFEGLYDPKMMAFTYGKTTSAGTFVESKAKDFTNVRRDGPTASEVTGVGTGPGLVSGVIKGLTQSHSQSFSIGGAAPVQIGVTTGAIATDITLDSLSNDKLMEIWAFLVANPSEAALEARVDELKTLIRAALPVFNSLSQNSTVKSLAVTSPVGPFSASEIGGGIRFTGFHEKGDAGLNLALKGLSVPEAIIPPWARNLVPGEISLDLKANGYDLAAVVDELLKVARKGSTKAESDAAGRRALERFAPDGKVKVILAPSKIVSKIVTIEMEGELTVFKPIPKGKLTLKAKGIDEALAVVQSAAASDPSLQQAVMALVTAKGFGKGEPDGSLTWVIANPDGGLPTVNGVALPGLGGK